jgi:hypothetical protein
MIHDCKTRLAARLLFLVAAAATTTPAAAAAFDGSWNVSIVTRTGSCESGASLPIRISNGRIESGAAPVSVSGRVGESGGIVVAMSSGKAPPAQVASLRRPVPAPGAAVCAPAPGRRSGCDGRECDGM